MKISKQIKTVSEITRDIQLLLENQLRFVRISGEVSSVRQPFSGHYYFNLKDDHSQLKAVLFKNQQRYLSQKLIDGQQVICDGRISVYEPRGEYQLIVDTIDFHGSGHLQIAFDSLKQELKSKGFFEKERKKILPEYVSKIVLITSPGGAAVHDFLAICRKRKISIDIQILPVPVQGDGSAESISESISTAHGLNPDVIVLCRGGGSIEDLWSFNDERVAQAIYDSSIPVVTGIGHETDFTIADFCADVRAPTPTGAAELLVPDGTVYGRHVDSLIARIVRSLRWQLETATQSINRTNRFLSTFDSAFDHHSLRFDNALSLFVSSISLKIERKTVSLAESEALFKRNAPDHQIEFSQNRLDHSAANLCQSIDDCILKKQSAFQKTTAVLDSLSPLATLARGYGIVSKKPGDKTGPVIITDSRQVKEKEEIAIKLHSGELDCIVSARRS